MLPRAAPSPRAPGQRRPPPVAARGGLFWPGGAREWGGGCKKFGRRFPTGSCRGWRFPRPPPDPFVLRTIPPSSGRSLRPPLRPPFVLRPIFFRPPPPLPAGRRFVRAPGRAGSSCYARASRFFANRGPSARVVVFSLRAPRSPSSSSTSTGRTRAPPPAPNPDGRTDAKPIVIGRARAREGGPTFCWGREGWIGGKVEREDWKPHQIVIVHLPPVLSRRRRARSHA